MKPAPSDRYFPGPGRIAATALVLAGLLGTALVPATLMVTAFPGAAGAAPKPEGSAWAAVARELRTSDTFANGYHRFNLPRKDIALKLGDVTVAPELALGAWAGFSDSPNDATMMGDLVLKASEVRSVLAELERQRLDVTAIHNHLLGEDPPLAYVHFHGMGRALDLATRLSHVIALTATPLPVAPAAPKPLEIDTAAVFSGLGRSGKAHGNVAQMSFILVPGRVTMHGRTLVPALAYGSPVNVQEVSRDRYVATGDFAIPGAKVAPLIGALARHGITATALHTHMIDESPKVYFIHFWADGKPTDVIRGLRAAVDAAR